MLTTDHELIQFLWNTGHFWDTNRPNVLNVTEADLPSLTLQDRVVEAAAASFQESDVNLAPLAMQHIGRLPVADGDVGPATRALAELPRCPIPDHAPPPNATFHYNDPELQQIVERMQELAATGSGSWPAGCDGGGPVHVITVSYDLSRMSAKQREWWPEVKQRAHAAWADIGVKLVEVPVGGNANITVYGYTFSGNIIGMAEFNNRSCRDVVFCRISSKFAPSLEDLLRLLLHEQGHNMNLNHRNGNIMNASLIRTPSYWIRRENGRVTYTDNSYPVLRGYFGGERVPGDEPPPPPPPPTDEVTRLILRMTEDVLGRPGTAVDVATLYPLAGDRQKMAYTLLSSDEHLTLTVREWYKDHLGRETDPAGQANFVRALKSGVNLLVAEGVVLASHEYFTRKSGSSIGLDPAKPEEPEPPPNGGFMGEIVKKLKAFKVQLEALIAWFKWVPGKQPDEFLEVLLGWVDYLLDLLDSGAATEAEVEAKFAMLTSSFQQQVQELKAPIA